MGDRDDDVADWLKGRPLTAEQALRRRLLQNVVPSDELAAVLPGAITHEDPRPCLRDDQAAPACRPRHYMAAIMPFRHLIVYRR
jgi:enoyl-CoA hydratase/carnithine racemase